MLAANSPNTQVTPLQIGASENCEIEAEKMICEPHGNCELISEMFQLSKEVMPEFKGEEFMRTWIAQLKNVALLYQLTIIQKNCYVCISKLKGKAMQWIHADPSRIVKSLDDLLKDLDLTFEN